MRPPNNPLANSAILCGTLAPLFIALSIICVKLAGGKAEPLIVAGLGSLLSVPMLLLYHVARDTNLKLDKLWTSCRSDFIQVLITRAILGEILIVCGFTMTSAVKSVLLLRLEPLFVLLWSVIYAHEKVRPSKLLALAVLLFGTFLVVRPDGSAMSGFNMGDGLIVVSLFLLSYSYMPTARVVIKAGPHGLNLVTNLLGGLVILIVASFAHGWQSLIIRSDAIAPILSYSFTFFVVAASLYFYAFEKLKPWIVSSLLSLEVVFGSLLALFILHEQLTPVQTLGGLIVIAATGWIASLGRNRPNDETPAVPAFPEKELSYRK